MTAFHLISAADLSEQPEPPLYLGCPERLMELATGWGGREIERIQVQEFGSLWLANLLDQEIGITELVDSVLSPAERQGRPRSALISSTPSPT